jgi:hypothetical protein
VKVPSEQSLASSSEAKPGGKPCKGSPKPDMSEIAGPVLSFENVIIVVTG